MWRKFKCSKNYIAGWPLHPSPGNSISNQFRKFYRSSSYFGLLKMATHHRNSAGQGKKKVQVLLCEIWWQLSARHKIKTITIPILLFYPVTKLIRTSGYHGHDVCVQWVSISTRGFSWKFMGPLIQTGTMVAVLAL